MPEDTSDSLTPTDSQDGSLKHVPVAEAIKYRRRAQQAESRAQQLEQQLEELQSRWHDQLATAEAQRDEAQTELTVAENRLRAERRLGEAGVLDLETAATLLAKRVDLAGELDDETLANGIEQLLVAKPFLHRSPDPALPSKTASARPPHPGSAGQVASAARRAVESGSRKDVAEYLRLKRQASTAG